jgi:hypothetical protein
MAPGAQRTNPPVAEFARIQTAPAQGAIRRAAVIATTDLYKVPLLACPAVRSGYPVLHCWTSQQWHTRRLSLAIQRLAILFARSGICAFFLATVVALTGCGTIPRFGGGNPEMTGGALLENPMFVPAVDREFLHNQTVDVVDNYFRIEREERVRLIGGILTEGRIDTFPKVGSTLLEPWRGDSTPGYERLHATLQSIRRKATVRIIPTEGGYLLDVAVQKELEDLDKPENATAGSATQRHDGTIVRQTGPAGRAAVTLGWIPLGRDVSLEQKILSELQVRLEVNCEADRLPSDAPIEPEDLLQTDDVQPTTQPSGPTLQPPTSIRQSGRPETLPPPVLERLPGL